MIALGETYLRADRIEDARAQAEQGVRLAQDGHEAGFLTWGLRLWGDITVHRDSLDISKAHTCYQQALARAHDLGMRPLQAHCHLGLGKFYVQTKHTEQAHAELSMARSLYQEMDMPFWLAILEAMFVEAEKQP